MKQTARQISLMLKRRRFWQLISLAIADGLFFGSTDAKNVTSIMLIVGFILFTLTVYQLVYGLLVMLKVYGVTVRHRQRLAGSLTGIIGGLIALQSIGQLGVRDLVVMLPLALMAYSYISVSKRNIPQR